MVSHVLRKLLGRSEKHNESVLGRVKGMMLDTPLRLKTGTVIRYFRKDMKRKHNWYSGVPIGMDPERVLPLSQKGHDLLNWLVNGEKKPGWMEGDQLTFYLKKPVAGHTPISKLKDFGKSRIQLIKKPKETGHNYMEEILKLAGTFSPAYVEKAKKLLSEIHEDLLGRGKEHEERVREIKELIDLLQPKPEGTKKPDTGQIHHFLSLVSAFMEKPKFKTIKTEIRRDQPPGFVKTALKEAGDLADLLVLVRAGGRSSLRAFIIDRGLNMRSIMHSIRSEEEAGEVGKAYADTFATGLKYGLRFAVDPINYVMNNEGRIIPVDEFDFAVARKVSPEKIIKFIELIYPTYCGEVRPGFVDDIRDLGLKDAFSLVKKACEFFKDIGGSKPENAERKKYMDEAEKSFFEKLGEHMKERVNLSKKRKERLERHIEEKFAKMQ